MLSKPLQYIKREGFDKTILSLVDQVVVSGTRFATTVLVGKFGSDAELGIYSLAFSFVVLVVCLQESLISIPYTVFVKRLGKNEQKTYSGSSLIQCVGINAIAIAFLMIGCVVAFSLEFGNDYSWLLVVLVILLPFMMLREFARRFAFAHLNLKSVVALDVGVSAFQLAGLLLIAYYGSMNATWAYVITGLACIIGCVAWFWLSRTSFKFVRTEYGTDSKKNWDFGKWVAGAHLIAVFHNYFAHWLLVAFYGEGSTGVYAACMTVVVLANPFILGISNVLSPKASHAFAEKGILAVRHMVWKFIAIVTLPLLTFSVLACFYGEQFVVWIFKAEYAGNQWTISMLAFGTIALGISYAVSSGLRAIDRPDVNLWAGISGFVVTAVLSLALVSQFALFGTAIGLVAGFFTMAIHRWIAFELIVIESRRLDSTSERED